MPITKEEDIRQAAVLDVANQMMIAARTAPKGCGVDNLQMVVISGEQIQTLANKMVQLVEKKGYPDFFKRDAQNILKAQVVLLI